MKLDSPPLTAPRSAEAIEREITRLKPLDCKLRGALALYTFRAVEAPALIPEVGRLREVAFRQTGAGTGREEDIDEGDLSERGYRQIVAWESEQCRVVGGYRYMIGRECDMTYLSSTHYFLFSERFEREILPRAIELGRSFAVRDAGSSSLFAMSALWHGLGQIVACEGAEYLFGKVTIPPRYDGEALRLLLCFLWQFFPAREALLSARKPLKIEAGERPFSGKDFAENFALLERLLAARGERVPPMIHAYMRLTREMQVFDAMINPDFSDAVEVAILLPVSEIIPAKREVYIKQ